MSQAVFGHRKTVQGGFAGRHIRHLGGVFIIGGNDFGFRIGIDGEKPFKDALKDINSNLKLLGSEMKLVSAQFDKSDTSVAALTARNKALNSVAEEQRNKVELLDSTLQQSAEAYGENDSRTMKWRAALNLAKADLIGTEKEIAANSKLLSENAKETDSAAKSGDNLTKSLNQFGKESKAGNASIKDISSLLKENLVNGAGNAKDAVSGLGKEIGGNAVSAAKSLGSGIKDTAAGIGTFIKDTVTGENTVKAFGNAIANKLYDALHKSKGELKDTADAADSLSKEETAAANETEKLGESLKKTGKDADDTKGRFAGIADVLKGVGAAIGATVTAVGAAAASVGVGMYKMAEDAAAAGREINNTSQKLGLSKQGFQEWDFILKKSGTSIDVMGAGMKSLQKTLGGLTEDGSSASKAFAAVGISFDEIKGKSPEDALNMTIRALQNMPAGADRSAAAMKLFGKAGMELQPLLNKTSAETDELRKRAHSLGLVMSDEQLAASSKFGGAMGKIKDTIAGMKLQIASSMIPAFGDGLSAILDFANGAEGGREKMKSAVDGITNAITSTVPQIVEQAGNMLSALAAGLSQALPGIAKAIGDALPSVIGTIKELLPQIVTAIMDAVPLVISGLLSALPLLTGAAADIITALVNGLKDMIPTLIPVAVEAVIQLAQGLLDSLPLILTAALDLITGLADGLLDAIPTIIEALPQIITSITTFLNKAIPQIVEAGIKLFTSIVEALPDIIKGIVPLIPAIINNLVSVLKENIPVIVKAGISLITSLVEALPEIIPVIVDAIPIIIDSIIEAVIEALPLLIEAGIDLFVALINALPEIIDKILEALPLIITSVLDALTDSIPKLVQAGVDLLTSLVENLPKIIDAIVEAIPKILTGITNALTNSIPKIIDAGVDLLVSLVTNLPKIIETVVKAIPEIVENLVTAVIKLVPKLAKAGEDLILGLWDGIKKMFTKMWDGIKDMFGGLVSGIKGIFGIHSPSTVFAEIGKYLSQGLGQGFLNDMKSVKDDMQKALPTDFDINPQIKTDMTGLKDAAADISDALKIESVQIVSFDLSGINNAAQAFKNSLDTGAAAKINANISGIRGAVDAMSVPAVPPPGFGGYQGADNSDLQKLIQQNSIIISLISDKIVPNMKKNIYLDGNTLAGYLAPEMDGAMGTLQAMKVRD